MKKRKEEEQKINVVKIAKVNKNQDIIKIGAHDKKSKRVRPSYSTKPYVVTLPIIEEVPEPETTHYVNGLSCHV